MYENKKLNRLNWRHYLVGALLPIAITGITKTAGGAYQSRTYLPKEIPITAPLNLESRIINEQTIENILTNFPEIVPAQKLEYIKPEETSYVEPQEKEYVQPQEEQIVYNEKENPEKFDFENGSEILALAKIGFAEGRAEWRNPEFVKSLLSVPLYRAKQSGKSVKDVILKPYQFTALSDLNKKYVENPLCEAEKNPFDKKAFEVFYDTAKELIEKNPYLNASHYFSKKQKSNWQPDWAKGQKPVKTIQCRNGEVTIFFNLHKK